MAEKHEKEKPDLDFGEPMGACLGVVAYSNLDDYYFSGEKAHCQGIFTGYKYQCVEFARRLMLWRYQCIFGQCGPAHEIFDMTEVTCVVDGKKHPFVACANTTTKVKPAPGMTLVYPIHKKMPVGHVAVIAAVGDDWVGIAEENESSKAWEGKPYSRKEKLLQSADGEWTIEETDAAFVPCRGWLYIDGVEPIPTLPGVTDADQCNINEKTLNEKIYPPAPKVIDDLLDAAQKKRAMAQFETKVVVPPTNEFDLKEDPRIQLQEEYKAILTRGSQGIPTDVKFPGSDAKDGYASRNAVRRTPEYHSVYAPNESLGVGTIGAAMRAFKIIEQAAIGMIGGAANDDAAAAAVSKHYGLPLELTKVAASQLLESQGASAALASADFGMAALGLSYDPDCDHFRIAHTEFDSLSYVIDINAFQDSYAKDVGFGESWRFTTFGNDFHRMVRNFLKFRMDLPKADAPLDFIDFGSLESLKAKGVQFTDDEAYQYEVEYVNHRYLVEVLKIFLDSKKKDFEAGDLLEKDMPHWNLKVSDFFSDSVVINVKDQTLDIGGAASKFVWKMLPWSLLLKIGEADTKAKSFLDSVCLRREQQVIHQPLWTFIVGHPAFREEMAAWVVEHEDKIKVSGIDRPSEYVIAPNSNYICKPPPGAVNPSIMGNAYTAPESDQRAKYTIQIDHSLIIGGKRSCGIYLEARSNTIKEGAPVSQAVHPAPMCFMPWDGAQ